MKKYLVIGNPINHSLSPKLHNYWIKQNNLNAIYDKKKIEPDNIQEVVDDLKNDKINGANVTIPFKKSIISFLDELTPVANLTQSVNTIYKKNNKIVGDNTDIGGFKQALRHINYDVKNKEIFILGAGGVVSSIIIALKKLGVSKICLSNRTKEKTTILQNFYPSLKIIDWGSSCYFDMIINATSLGLKNKDKIELDFSKIGKNKLFYDVIYNPSKTNFILKGQELGNKTENGKMMFIYQAQLAFKIWHNILPKVHDKLLD